MASRFRVAAALPLKMEELGVSPADVLRRAGLPSRLFEQEKILVDTDELFALYQGLAEASPDPAIGLKLGTEDRLERYSPVALAAVSARSFRDAVGRLARYKQLVCPEELRVTERADGCRLQFRWLLAEHPEPPILVDMCFAWIVAIARRGTGERITPLRVELRGATRNRAMYEDHFGSPVTFGSRLDALVFRPADFDRPFITHNPDVLAIVAPPLDAELSQALAGKAIGDQVKAIVKGLLAGRRPGIEDVARELRLSARTLQRRLAGDGATFQQMLEEARRELARHYLEHSALELNETAYLLGYEDAHSFFRAFQQWEGTSPGVWRARHVRAPRPGPRAGAAGGAPPS